MKKINVLIVEDFPNVRESLKLNIDKLNADSLNPIVTVAGEASDFDTADALIRDLNGTENQIHLVLLDYHLTGYKTGLDISKKHPHIGYIVITDDISVIQKIESEKHLYEFMVHVADDNTLYMQQIMAEIRKFHTHFYT